MTSSIATKSKTRTAPEPEPTKTGEESNRNPVTVCFSDGPAGPPSLDELVARRMLDWHGDSLIDIYIDRVRRAEVGWAADRDDPYGGYLQMSGWCASRRLWARDRHATAAHATLMRAVATGADVVPIDEAAIDRAVAKDLVGLYAKNCRGAFGRLVAAARRKKDAAASELDELRSRLTGGSSYDPRSTTGWRELKDLLGRERELLDSVARCQNLLADLGPALAGHVAPILDDAGVDRVVLGMCLASLPTAPASLEGDPTLVRLGADLAAARGRHEALSDAGSPAERATWAAMEEELTSPIAVAIYSRREEIAAERSLAATAALESVRTSVEAARSGDVAACEALLSAARAHPGDFPEAFAAHLHDAATDAFVEDALGWSELLESA